MGIADEGLSTVLKTFGKQLFLSLPYRALIWGGFGHLFYQNDWDPFLAGAVAGSAAEALLKPLSTAHLALSKYATIWESPANPPYSSIVDVFRRKPLRELYAGVILGSVSAAALHSALFGCYFTWRSDESVILNIALSYGAATGAAMASQPFERLYSRARRRSEHDALEVQENRFSFRRIYSFYKEMSLRVLLHGRSPLYNHSRAVSLLAFDFLMRRLLPKMAPNPE